MKLQLSRNAQPVYAPNWHPNFRNAELLPDLKVIRTSFFVNLVCVTVASAALLFTAFREYTAFSYRADIRQSERHVEAAKEQNAKLLAMNREFTEANRKFTEAIRFADNPVVASDLLVALSKSLPANMEFSSVAYENDQLTLRGSIRGASDNATADVSTYLEVLRKDPALNTKFPDVSLTSMLRDARTQGMSYEILLRPAPAKPGAKAIKQ
jgi:hypothetical protein